MPRALRPARRGRILVSLLAPALRGGRGARCVGRRYTLVSRSREILELDQKAIQLDKARSLSQQVAVYVKSLRSAGHRPSRAPSRWTRPRTVRRAGGAHPRARRRSSATSGENSRFYSVSVVRRHAASRRAAPASSSPSRPSSSSCRKASLRGLQGKSMVSHPVVSTSLQEPVMVLAEPGEARRRRRAGRGAGRGQPAAALEHDRARWARRACSTSTSWTAAAGSSPTPIPRELEGDLDVSDVEIVQQFLDSKGRAGATVPFTIAEPKDGPSKMLGTYTARARRLRLGRHRPGRRGQGLLQRAPDAATSRWPWWPS